MSPPRPFPRRASEDRPNGCAQHRAVPVLGTRWRQREPFPQMPIKPKEEGNFSPSIARCCMSFPERRRLPAVLPQGSSVLHSGKGDRGDPGAEPGPHHPLPEPALKLSPHSSSRVWDSASSPFGCLLASDLALLLIPGSSPLAWVPNPGLVTCSIVI